MKAIIWIIVLALVAWGIWWFVQDRENLETADNGANVSGAIDFNANASGDDDVDLTEFNDKG